MDLATIEIMRELAALKGERSADGSWKTDKVSTLEGYLLRATRMQARVEQKAAAKADA